MDFRRLSLKARGKIKCQFEVFDWVVLSSRYNRHMYDYRDCKRSITRSFCCRGRFSQGRVFGRVAVLVLTQHSLPDGQAPQEGERGGHLRLLPNDQVLPLHSAWRHPLNLVDRLGRWVAIFHEVWPHGGQKLGHSVKGRNDDQTP